MRTQCRVGVICSAHTPLSLGCCECCSCPNRCLLPNSTFFRMYICLGARSAVDTKSMNWSCNTMCNRQRPQTISRPFLLLTLGRPAPGSVGSDISRITIEATYASRGCERLQLLPLPLPGYLSGIRNRPPTPQLVDCVWHAYSPCHYSQLDQRSQRLLLQAQLIKIPSSKLEESLPSGAHRTCNCRLSCAAHSC